MPEVLTTQTRDVHQQDDEAQARVQQLSTTSAAPITLRPQIQPPIHESRALPPAPRQDAEPNFTGPTAIIEAFAAAQGQFTAVAKTKTATVTPRGGGASYKYQYADLADVLAMATPILSKNGLCITQPMRRVGNTLMLITELWHKSGQVLRDDGLPLDMGNGPQALGSSLTYMRRYGACSILGIAPDADDDAQLAEQDRKEAAELERAKARNARATEAAALLDKKASEKRAADAARAASGDPVITPEQVKELNRLRKITGHSAEETAKYINGTYGVPLTQLPTRHFEVALAWAGTKPTGAERTTPAEHGSTAPPARIGPTLDGEQQRTFWDTSKKHGKTSGEVSAYLKQRFQTDSSAGIPVSAFAEALEWATASLDKRPPMSHAEKNAREGFNALGLNLNEQAALVELHKGDWEAIGQALDEVARQQNSE